MFGDLIFIVVIFTIVIGGCYTLFKPVLRGIKTGGGLKSAQNINGTIHDIQYAKDGGVIYVVKLYHGGIEYTGKTGVYPQTARRKEIGEPILFNYKVYSNETIQINIIE